MTTETEVVDRVARGEGPNPCQFFSCFFAALRITGTGASYRPSINEYVYRERDVWLSPAMRARCVGLPITKGHPPGGLLDSDSFQERIVGFVVRAFVRGDELWGVARVFDRDIAETIAGGRTDTSPAIAFGPDSQATAAVETTAGEVILIEGEPSLVDHLALCESGVWTRATTAPTEEDLTDA